MLNRVPLTQFLVLLLAVSCFPDQPASAQFGMFPAGGRPGTVSGAGDSTIELKPEVMRLHVDLMAKGGTLKEAFAALRKRKESARQSLEKLGADKDSVEFGQASISDAQSEEQQQLKEMMAMIEEQRGRTGRPTTPQTSVPITVTCSLSAEWKLSADSTEELLLFVHPLQQKIRDADLSGAKDASALSPEQQELLEEMQGEFGYDSYYSSSEPEPGTPVFTFAAPIGEEQVDRALAEAFQRARTDAARLSKATGAELGKLVSVSNTVTQVGDDDASYEEQYYYSQLMQAAGVSIENDANEAVSFKPGTVKKRFTVTASFDFKE